MIQATIELAEPLATAFAHCSAEAQTLEHAIKSAITKDVHVFAKVGEQTSFLDALEIATLGNAQHIVMGTSTRKGHKEIAACVGFYEFVKMQWGFTGRPESELSGKFTDAVRRRNPRRAESSQGINPAGLLSVAALADCPCWKSSNHQIKVKEYELPTQQTH